MSEKYFDPFNDLDNLQTEVGVANAIKILQEQFDKGNGKSGYMLALLNSADESIVDSSIKASLGLSDEEALACYERAYAALLAQADSGDAEAMYLIASYYQGGLPPVSESKEDFNFWINKSKVAGYNSPQY